MGKGRPRAVEKSGAASATPSSSSSSAAVPQAPVFYPTEEEFLSPLDYIHKIRPEAEPFGICRIVPPKSWSPPFALDRDAFAFPTKTQAIHRLQTRPPSCDPDTFALEYSRFLEDRLGKRPSQQRRRLIFEGAPLDLCRLFNAVKRFGGYNKVCKEKRWGEVAWFVRPASVKVSECAKHVLSQLYLEHLLDYEEHTADQADLAPKKSRKCSRPLESSGCKRRRKNAGCSRVEEEVLEQSLFDQICEQCKSGLHGEVMLLCDRCDKGWHLYCLSPPLESVPMGNWYCLECVNSEKDSFGFVPGKLCTLQEFRRMNERMKKKWFGQTNASRVQIEKRFWEIVEGRLGEVEVMYGNDLDTSLYGSGFPRVDDDALSTVDANVWRQYASSPWNLNNLPKLQGSMLRAVHENIAGVMVPWLYIGMLFSSFCWHVEDHCFYSINYLHWGEPKCWYGIPGSEANAFEQVMQNALPDLFEAQPDLLFQLVTMLNPSILQENGVSVYGVLQEPGNFVITFPRSFHAGFNLGLNCAEAVNFAPADWLPHGRVGAELYRLYHKAAILSHEELVCVAAKSNCDIRSFPYIKEEMQKVYDIEKKCREELWISGINRSSQMDPRKHANFIGTEEDATCIICHQYLYLSAITCSCRPSGFVCLEHWRHLCECGPEEHQLLYRHTLAELGDLVYMRMPCGSEQTNGHSNHLGSSRSSNMTKKVKGAEVSYVRLAEDWLSESNHILECPFSHAAYISALKEAEQFIWADHNMDSVRDMAVKLSEAQRWALDINSCLSKVSNYMDSQKKHTEKVSLCELERVSSISLLPCYEPSLSKLKDYTADARKLVAEMASAFSSYLSICDLEALYSQAAKFPVSLPSTEKLASEISSAKVWLKSAHSCITEEKPGSVNIDLLNNLKSQMLELCVRLPEMDMLSNICKEVESWQSQCEEILKGPIRLKELEEFLLTADNLTVIIPEISVLRKYSYEARSWMSSAHTVLQEIKELKDHGCIVGELSRILNAGQLLRVQVDELPLVEMELKMSSCRQTASKALETRFPLNSIQQVLLEALKLGIENEQLFIDISKLIDRATSWEEKTKYVLENGAQIAVFDDITRESEDIPVILPTLPLLKDAVSTAKSWIARSQPYLEHAINGTSTGLSLKADELKELVSLSNSLKVRLDAPERLESILRKVEGWDADSCSLLEKSKNLFDMHYADFLNDNSLCTKIEELLSQIDSAIVSGNSLGLALEALPQLKSLSWSLSWCLRALSFCHKVPLLQEADGLLGDSCQLPVTLRSSCLVEVLIGGINWLKRALLLLPETQNSGRCDLKDVELILEEVQKIVIPYPVMVTALQTAMQKHESWVKQAHALFELPEHKSWPSLLMLKEHGDPVAFNCLELDKINSEIQKVKGWMSQCQIVLEPLVGDHDSLSAQLIKIKDSLDRALCICSGSKGRKTRVFSVCCSDDPENEEVYTCLTCEDRYHFSCVGPALANAGTTNEYSCPFCHLIESGVMPRDGSQRLISRGNRPEVKSFFELLSTAGNLFAGVNEFTMVEEIVEKIVDFKSYLTKIINNATYHCDKDLSSISESLLNALKALRVCRIYDHQDCCNLELTLSRNLWKVRVKKLLRGSKKPIIQQILHLIKEGTALKIPSEDHFMKEITEVKGISLCWAEIAEKVASDSGKLALSEVYKLINEGENLPVHLEKELKLLRDRSMLYCICRKPYDHQRPMVACDQCNEWYHFDCIKLCEPLPKTFYCTACQLPDGVLITLPRSLNLEERTPNDIGPHTPPACSSVSNQARAKDFGLISPKKSQSPVDLLNDLRSFDDVHLWRENKKSLHRTAKRRINLDGLFHYLGFPLVNR